MKKTGKRFLISMMTVVLMLTLFIGVAGEQAAYAKLSKEDTGKVSDGVFLADYRWLSPDDSDDGGYFIIRAYSESLPKDVIIPAEIEGKKIRGIWGYALSEELMESVTISEGLWFIDEGAFYNCPNLKRVNIPASVTEIDSKAFDDCPEDVEVIVASGNKYYTAENVITKYKYPVYENGFSAEYMEEYGGYAISDIDKEIINSSKGKLTIPAEIQGEKIAAVLNVDTGSASTVKISEGITTLRIGDLAFSRNLKSIEIPASVTEIKEDAFTENENLTKITVASGNKKYTSVDGVLFSKDMTTLILYPKNRKATSYTIPSGVKTIKNQAFLWCENLKSVSLPEGLVEIEEFAFLCCENLEQVTMPDSVTTIGDRAFYECRALKNITISKGLKTIGGEAFYRCGALKGFYIPNGVKEIGDYALRGSMTTIKIPKSVTKLGKNPFDNCYNLESITVASGNKEYTSVDGVLFTKDMKTLIHYPAAREAKKYTIPSGVTTIGDNAFSGCDYLESISMPKSVTTIGDYAFGSCYELTKVKMSKNVKTIGYKAFLCCYGLPEITIPKSVKTIGSDVFEFCESLKTVTILADVELPGFNRNFNPTVIYGLAGSGIEKYAKSNNLPFEAID